jgi:hypothetical protein
VLLLLNGVINLLDDDNKKEEEGEETSDSLINIDDGTEFPSLSASLPSPSPTERPQKRTDIKRTPSKLDSRSSTSAQSSIRLPSKAVKLSQKDEANSTGSMKQSKLSFNRNGNISLKINSRASSLLPTSNNNRSKKCNTRSNSKDNSNKKAGTTTTTNNNNNQSNKEGNTKTD